MAWVGVVILLNFIYIVQQTFPGMTVTATLLNANPAGYYTLAGTATGVLYPAYGGYMIRFTGIPGLPVSKYERLSLVLGFGHLYRGSEHLLELRLVFFA